MKPIVTCAFLFVLLANGFAQSDYREGYVIDNNADTLFGFVNYREGSMAHTICDFKAAKASHPVSYTPDEIIRYGFVNGRNYERKVSSYTDNKVVFMEVIVEGFVSLYRFETTFIIEKRNEGLHPLLNETRASELNGKKVMKQTNQHISTLNMLLFDCVDLRERISKIKVSERDFTNLVNDYNLCKGEQSVTYKAKTPWLKVDAAVFGGVNISKIRFRKNNPDFDHLVGTFDKSQSLAAGISLDLFTPRASERLSFHVDVFYLQDKYFKYSETNTFFSREKNYVTIELQELKMPVGLRYTLPNKRITPYLSAGVSNTFHLKAESSWIREVDDNAQYQTYESDALTLQKYQLGFWAGVGTTVKITPKLSSFIEVRYEQTDGIGSGDQEATPGIPSNVVSQVSNFQFFVGIRTR